MSKVVNTFSWQVEGRTVGGLEVMGDGATPVVVFLHGNSSCSASFALLLRSSALAGHHMLAVDLPGHGGTQAAATPQEYAVPALALWLQALVAQLNGRPFVLVGHSLGGHVASHAAKALMPYKLKGLVLLSAPPISTATMGQAFKADADAGGCLFKAELTSSDVQLLAKALLGPAASHAGHMDQLMTSIHGTDALFRPGLGASLAQGELADEQACLQDANVPVALIGGGQDAFLQASYLASFRASVPLGEGLYVLPDSGHSPHIDDPERVSHLLAGLLSGLA